jgi:hypothetical protein
MIEFFVVIDVDGVEWRRASAMVDGKPEFAKTAHKLLDEFRKQPNSDVMDRVTIRFDKVVRNA